MLTKSESEPTIKRPINHNVEFTMKKFEFNRELAQSLKTGTFSERLRKELLEEAYKAQVEKLYTKSIYFYKQVL